MSEFVQIDPVDTGTLKLEIYVGGYGELFLRIAERAFEESDWNAACLSAEEAKQVVEFIVRALKSGEKS